MSGIDAPASVPRPRRPFLNRRTGRSSTTTTGYNGTRADSLDARTPRRPIRATERTPGIFVFFFTNQSGVRVASSNRDDLTTTARTGRLRTRHQGRLSMTIIRYCPHHPRIGRGFISRTPIWRQRPSPGMNPRSENSHGRCRREGSFVIGDRRPISSRGAGGNWGAGAFLPFAGGDLDAGLPCGCGWLRQARDKPRVRFFALRIEALTVRQHPPPAPSSPIAFVPDAGSRSAAPGRDQRNRHHRAASASLSRPSSTTSFDAAAPRAERPTIGRRADIASDQRQSKPSFALGEGVGSSPCYAVLHLPIFQLAW